MRRRLWWKRPGVLALAVVVVVALGAAAGVWLDTRSASSGPQAATASTSTSVPLPISSSEPTTVAKPISTTEPTVVTKPATSLGTVTTAAVGPPVSAPGSMTYTLAAGTPIEVVALNRCWIEVRQTASGPITSVTTLQPGQTLALTAPVWVRLGNPENVHVRAGTTALQLPVGPGDLVITST